MEHKNLPDHRDDILLELEAMSETLEANVTDAESDADQTPDVIGMMRRTQILEKRLQAFDRYGVDSMEALKADPVFQRDNLLFRAVHSMRGATGRWAERKQNGQTDVDLLAAFDVECGVGHTSYHGDEGEYNCRIESFSYRDRTGAMVLVNGSALAKLLRHVLRVPLPAGAMETEQLNLFA